MPSAPEPTVWPALHYDDTAAALRFLVDVFGLRAAIAVDDDEGDPVHDELGWPAGGAVAFGSTKHTGEMRAGPSAGYVVADDVDAVFRRAVAANAEIVEPPHQTAFGSGVPTRAVTARDPEGTSGPSAPTAARTDRRAAGTRFPSPGSRSVRASRRPARGRSRGTSRGRAVRTTSTTAIAYRSGRTRPLAALPPIVRAGRPLRSRGYARLSREARAAAPHIGSPGRRS
jgi:uncharacterized glyoxalase superfamily protein PhnB